MTVSIPRESVENLAVKITTDADPVALPVRFAFTQGTTRPTTWIAGSWSGAATAAGGRWTATALTPLIGTGTADLAPGSWVIWCQIDGATEDPVIRAGSVTIT